MSRSEERAKELNRSSSDYVISRIKEVSEGMDSARRWEAFKGGTVGMMFLADSIDRASKRISGSIDGYTAKIDEHFKDEKERFEKIPENPFERMFSSASTLPNIPGEDAPEAEVFEEDNAVVLSLSLWQNVKTLLKECESVLVGPDKTEAEVALGSDVEGLLNMIEEFERGSADPE